VAASHRENIMPTTGMSTIVIYYFSLVYLVIYGSRENKNSYIVYIMKNIYSSP